jgi:hypothetical protein
MPLSEMLNKAAMAEIQRKLKLEAEEQAAIEKAQRKKLWGTFNAACEFLPRGPAESAARTWAALLIPACQQLKTLNELGRLQAMRYKGPDPVVQAGTDAAFEVCRLACINEFAAVRTALERLIESAPKLQDAFRTYLESIRDNRQWWATAQDSSRG